MRPRVCTQTGLDRLLRCRAGAVHQSEYLDSLVRYAQDFHGSAAHMASLVASDIAVVLGPRDFEKSTTTSGQAEHIEVVSQPRLLSPPTYGLSGSFRNFQLV